jgi:hypothetical protein
VTPTGFPSSAHCAPSGVPPPVQRPFPPEDWNDAIPEVAEITDKINPERRNRTCPRAVKRARHNSYRIKKPDEPSSTRHPSPPTINEAVLLCVMRNS